MATIDMNKTPIESAAYVVIYRGLAGPLAHAAPKLRHASATPWTLHLPHPGPQLHHTLAHTPAPAPATPWPSAAPGPYPTPRPAKPWPSATPRPATPLPCFPARGWAAWHLRAHPPHSWRWAAGSCPTIPPQAEQPRRLTTAGMELYRGIRWKEHRVEGMKGKGHRVEGMTIADAHGRH